MSLVSIALDSILFLLLIFALWYGMRLERRLKELRNAYSGFATAVVDLDASAAKAQKALNDMRQTSESTQDLIHERVLTARELTAKLEVQVERAERVLAQLEKIPNFTTQMPMSGRKDPETLIDRPVTSLPERAPRVRATHGGGGGGFAPIPCQGPGRGSVFRWIALGSGDAPIGTIAICGPGSDPRPRATRPIISRRHPIVPGACGRGSVCVVKAGADTPLGPRIAASFGFKVRGPKVPLGTGPWPGAVGR